MTKATRFTYSHLCLKRKSEFMFGGYGGVYVDTYDFDCGGEEVADDIDACR